MSDDLKRKKSDYLLELALEEQLENDGEMQAYQSGNERPHEFSDEHNRCLLYTSSESRHLLYLLILMTRFTSVPVPSTRSMSRL